MGKDKKTQLYTKVTVSTTLVYELVCMHAEMEMPSIDGSLYGVAQDGVLHVTGFIPGPTNLNTDYARHVTSVKDDMYKQQDIILECGHYQVTSNNEHLKEKLIDQLSASRRNGIFLLIDVTLLPLKKLAVKAYTLSDAFVKLTASLLDASGIKDRNLDVPLFTELPCSLSTSALEAMAKDAITCNIVAGLQEGKPVPLTSDTELSTESTSSIWPQLAEDILTRIVTVKEQQSETEKRIDWLRKNGKATPAEIRAAIVSHALLAEALRYSAETISLLTK